MTRLLGFILAAGEGRRLRPATLARPKALMPFCGTPLLDLAVSEMRHCPHVDTIVVNAFSHAQQVVEACQRLDVLCSVEEELLNHGGGIREGLRRYNPNATEVLVRNADVVHNFPLEELVRLHHARTEAAATLLLIDNHRTNGVLVDENHHIISYSHPQGTLTFAGIYIINRQILDYLTPGEKAPSIITALTRAAEAGLPIYGVVAPKDTFWHDLGTPADYIRAHAQIFDYPITGNPLLQQSCRQQVQRRMALEATGVACNGPLGIGDNVQIPPGSALSHLVIDDNTRLDAPHIYSGGIMGIESQAATPYNHTIDPRIYATLNIPQDDQQQPATPPPANENQQMRRNGSARLYQRLTTSNGNTLIWCGYSPTRRENSCFASIDAFLEQLGLAVPKIHIHLPDSCQIVMEDLGEMDLLHAPDELYRQAFPEVLRQIALLHVNGVTAARELEPPLQPPFTRGLYNWERDYFRMHMLQTLLDMDEIWQDCAGEYQQLRRLLLTQPLVPVHRDLQCTNIILKEGKPYFIDFQGMRLGAAAYDLASLLYDPYRPIAPQQRLDYWQQYAAQVTRLNGTPPPQQLLHAAAVQRLLQALGAFGKLWRQDGLTWFSQYIAVGLEHLFQAAQAGDFPCIAAMAQAAAQKWQQLSQE